MCNPVVKSLGRTGTDCFSSTSSYLSQKLIQSWEKGGALIAHALGHLPLFTKGHLLRKPLELYYQRCSVNSSVWEELPLILLATRYDM